MTAMMDVQLNSWLLFSHAGTHHAGVEVVSRMVDGGEHRYTYAEFSRRTQQLMHALDSLELSDGARVGTLAWNHHRHLECYFGVPCTGRVLHTLNVRLSAQELAYIIQDAGDEALLVDADLLPLLDEVRAAGGLEGVRHVIVLGERGADGAALAYEELLATQPETYEERSVDEHAPLGMCYTSGTTGRPKGVVYTHRSVFLHALAATSATALSIGPADCALPVVPMFHAMAWGVPHAAVASGAKLVLMAGSLDASVLLELCERERVTVSAGVPTVWLALGDAIAQRAERPQLTMRCYCGGSQPPRPLIERFRRDFNIPIVQLWGMTETSPLATAAIPRHAFDSLDDDEVTARARCQAGLPIPGLDVSVRDEQGREVPADGQTMGDLYVRGPWVASGYWKNSAPEPFEGGWFRTGDVAIMSPDGYFVIADRSKDLIKSGGEWISSVDMEGDIMAMPGVVEAAVVAVPDPRWQERPLAAVVAEPGAPITLESVRAHLEQRGWARWQLPDRVELVDQVPRTSVGKFDKKVLRARFAEVAPTTQ